jgi:hypothetical protein
MYANNRCIVVTYECTAVWCVKGRIFLGVNEAVNTVTAALKTLDNRTFMERRYTGLFKMIVGVLTTCHKQYT